MKQFLYVKWLSICDEGEPRREVESVGWLIDETEDFIRLEYSRFVGDFDDDGGLLIAKAEILEMVPLKEQELN